MSPLNTTLLFQNWSQMSITLWIITNIQCTSFPALRCAKFECKLLYPRLVLYETNVIFSSPLVTKEDAEQYLKDILKSWFFENFHLRILKNLPENIVSLFQYVLEYIGKFKMTRYVLTSLQRSETEQIWDTIKHSAHEELKKQKSRCFSGQQTTSDKLDFILSWGYRFGF